MLIIGKLIHLIRYGGYAILSVLDDKKTINLINLNGGNRWYKSIRVKSCQNITIKDLLRFDVEFRKKWLQIKRSRIFKPYLEIEKNLNIKYTYK